MPAIFNRSVKQLQRIRSSLDPTANKQSDYLKDEVANRVIDRLLFLKREFKHVVDLGGGNGHIARSIIAQQDTATLKSRIRHLTVTDLALSLAERDGIDDYQGLNVTRQAVDEESLPFGEQSIDAIVSNLALHWVNDLPGALIQIRRSLVPDGPFLGTMFGGDTLFELRTSLQLAENERHGGLGLRVSPMTDVKDVGSLLNRAGFKLTTIDVDDIVVDYPDIFALMTDLQQMGESNAILARSGGPISRDTLMAAQAIYQKLHGNEDGSIPATFHIIYMIGWAPGQTTPVSQPKGSGQASLKKTLAQIESEREKEKKKKRVQGVERESIT